MSLGDQTKLLDLLTFTNVPLPSEATLVNESPFVVSISAGDVGDHYITLYSQYSRARPYQYNQNNWNHLLPQWRFTDTDGNQVDKIKTTDTTITNAQGNAIGVTGYAEFYYIDDMPTLDYSSPVMLWATLEVSGRPVSYDSPYSTFAGYANSKVVDGITYYINGQPPTYLTITKNGIDPINELKWLEVQFRYTILLKGDLLSGLCPNISAVTVFDYPTETLDAFAATHPINRTILSVPASSQGWTPDPAYFNRLEAETQLHTGGFQIGSVESSAVAINTQLSANVTVSAGNVFRDTPYAWISNGELRTINKVGVSYNYGSAYLNPLNPQVTQFSYSDISYAVSAVSGGSYWVGGGLSADTFGGIYGMAVTPCYSVWAVDPELDQLFNFNVDGVMLTSIDVDSEGSSPQSIALDSNLNMWITLYGATSTVKYDNSGALLTSVALPPFSVPDNDLVRPVQVDTDVEDNIWVTYEHPLCSMLLKYDSSGSFLASAALPLSAQPYGLVVDPSDNSVWVADGYEVLVAPYSWQYAASGGEIRHFTSDGAFISAYVDLPHPAYLTFDVNNNLWFTFGYSGVGVLSGSSINKYFLSAGNVDPYTAQHIAIDNSQLGLNERLNGLAGDARNRIWALNSRESNAYIIPTQNPLSGFVVPITPSDVNGVPRSIQGLGDWTGHHWFSKYLSALSLSTSSYIITGISNVFSIDNFGEGLDIRKFNASWDAAQQMQDYALPEHIHDNPNLFDNYLHAMVGGLSAQEESIGRKSYERTANFVANHVDVDTCEMDQLYSLSDELDVPMDDYRFAYPQALQRVMNLVSISHQKLWGTRCRCRRNFFIKQTCTNCGHSHCLNRARTPLDQTTYSVSGGVPIVIRPVFGTETYDVLRDITYPTSGVPLSATSSLVWLQSADYNDYYFYKYIPTFCDTQQEGVVNWDDQYTTLSENNSSLSAWYDENELVDIMISQVLYDGLQLE